MMHSSNKLELEIAHWMYCFEYTSIWIFSIAAKLAAFEHLKKRNRLTLLYICIGQKVGDQIIIKICCKVNPYLKLGSEMIFQSFYLVW